MGIVNQRKWRFKPPLNTPINCDHPLGKSLFVQYLFNENAGTKIFEGVNGAKYSGSLAATISKVWNTGPTGVALNVAPSGSQNKITLNNAFPVGTTFTVEFRVKLIALANTYQAIAANAAGTTAIYFQTTTSTPRLELYNGGNAFSTASFLANQYYHIAIVCTGGAYAYYINGVKDPSTYSGWTAQSWLYLLTDPFNLSLQGNIDYFRLYNRALNQSELFQILTDPYCMMTPPSPYLLEGVVGGGVVYNDTISGSIAAADAFAIAAVFNASLSDSIAGADSQAVTGTFNPNFSDAITASDSMAAANVMSASTSDSIAASDIQTVIGTFNPSFTDTVTADFTVTGGVLFVNSTSDSITAADALSNTMTLIASTLDSVAALDALSNTAVMNNAFTDSIAASDALTQTLVMNAATTDTITASDGIAGGLIFTDAISGNIFPFDILTTQIQFSAAFADTIIAHDVITAGNVFNDFISDSIMVFDTLTLPNLDPNYILKGWIH